MKLLLAYFDGWRVAARALAFALCLGLFSLPVVLAVMVFKTLQPSLLADAVLGFAVLVCFPVACYLASWYSGEFRAQAAEEEKADEVAEL